MRFPEKDGGEILVSTPVQPDGSFSCLVGFQDRFYVWIEEEGWQAIKDYNRGRGYKIPPGEELLLDYTFCLLYTSFALPTAVFSLMTFLRLSRTHWRSKGT